jgi:hypothetical protein
METSENNAMFSELTADEAAALNGGYYCYTYWAYRCYYWWYRRYCRYFLVRRCY